MQKIIPFYWFNNNAEEAINFYVKVFSENPKKAGESKIISMEKYPENFDDPNFKGMEGKIITGVFELNGQKFMALDGGPHFHPSGAISMYVDCDDQEETDYLWERLSEGGDPKNQQCGWLTDKYGFSWQIIPKRLPELLNTPDKAKRDKVLKAMLSMKKIEVTRLEEATS